MKQLTKLMLLLLITVTLPNCKKSETAVVFKPRFFTEGGNGFSVFDTRDIKNVKSYFYEWNSVTQKYEYNSTQDTTMVPNLKLWPPSVTDPVGVGYNYHFLNRPDGSTTYNISYGSSLLVTSSLTTDYPVMPSAWKQANKIEGYANLYELYGSVNGPSYFFFDLEAGTYLLIRDGAVIADEAITQLIITPKGSLTSSTIDFTKADAVVYDFDEISVLPLTNNIYFLDYDAMKYLQISRLNNIPGETARNTLVTSDWTPISNLLSGWKF